MGYPPPGPGDPSRPPRGPRPSRPPQPGPAGAGGPPRRGGPPRSGPPRGGGPPRRPGPSAGGARPGRRQQSPAAPQLSRRGFLVAAGATLAGVGVLALDPFGGGGDAASPEVRTLAGADGLPDPATHTFDLVVRGGRVIDPDSGYDAVADVGIDGGTVTAIGTELRGASALNAKGLVVAPGFIDILSYEPNEYGIWFKVADGVTTNLGLHGLRSRAADYFSVWGSEGKRPPTHYGGAFSHPWTREQLGLGVDDTATADQIDQMVTICIEDLRDGYIAVDFEPEYVPGTTFDEIKALTEVAEDHDVPATFHARFSDDVSPGTNAEALAEVLKVARETGARVHVEHIISTGGTYTMQQSLATLEQARADGVEVTACTYPYDYWATYLASARFNDGWQERFHISYRDLAIVGTGQRLTESTFAKHQQKNSLTAAFAIPEADVREALRAEWVMLGSDAILEPGDRNHPRSTGCFARTLGHYVRDEGVISLSAALAKATILPAKLLEAGAPAMRKKGRVQIGADADLTVFDPDTIIDRSTIESPGVESEGVRYVVIAGEVVRDPDGNRRETRPGTAIQRR